MDDKSLRQDVIDALDWDPSVDSANVGVAVEDGVAVLSGHVSTYAQKIAAQKIAQRVKGVTAIADELEVYRTDAHSDAEIAARAVQMLDWDVVIPDGAVNIKVSKGWVALSGQVEWDYQRRAAEADVRKLGGVTGVTNAITIKPRVSPSDISERIKQALKRDAELEAAQVHVSVTDGKVTLKGNVHTYWEREAVERAVWAAPGVLAVEDDLLIG